VREFNTLFSGTGKVFRDEGNAMDRKNLTVIAYAEFQNVIEIDRNRNVIYDFAV